MSRYTRLGWVTMMSTLLLGAFLLWVMSQPQTTRAETTTIPGHSQARFSPAAFTDTVFLPIISYNEPVLTCPTTSSQPYSLVPLLPSTPPLAHPDSLHADLNLNVRGYLESASGVLALIANPPAVNPGFIHSDTSDTPHLLGLFADSRIPDVTDVYQVYNWDWSAGPNGGQGSPQTVWETTLIGLDTNIGESVLLPARNTEIFDGGFKAVVLYADETSLTVTYEHTDSVAIGYSIHLDNFCVDPNLLALYRAQNNSSGQRINNALPGLASRQFLGQANGQPLRVAVRYYGNFTDPRSTLEWWRNDLGNISGQVTDQSALPFPEAIVRAYQQQGGVWQVAKQTTAASSGNYIFSLPAGTYRIGYFDPNGELSPIFYAGSVSAPDVNSASNVVLPAATQVNGIDGSFFFSSEILVTTTADDLNLGPNGTCSLREAIIAANTDTAVDSCPAGSGDDLIIVPAGTYLLTIIAAGPDPTRGDLDITSPLVINGTSPGSVIIDGNGIDRVFHGQNADFDLNNLIIQGGLASGGGGVLNDGGIVTINFSTIRNNDGSGPTCSLPACGNGGGILIQNGASTSLNNSTIGPNNQANFGGGIDIALGTIGSLQLFDSMVISNSSLSSGGGIFLNEDDTASILNSTINGNVADANGGGIVNGGQISINNSRIENNASLNGFSGGGIINWDNGQLTIENSTISGNDSDSDGGGVQNFDDLGFSPVITITGSTIRDNIASGAGGGIHNTGTVTGTATVSIRDSAIHDNSASSDGGGIANETDGVIDIVNSTVSGNSASTTGGGFHNNGDATLLFVTVANNIGSNAGGGLLNIGNLSFGGSIIAGNSTDSFNDDCSDFSSLSFTSLGENVVGSSTGCPTVSSDVTVSPTDVFSTVLDSLQLNAPGQTPTHALLPSSPAIDNAPLSCPPPTTDQRGMTRPQRSACDSGAYELP